MNQNLNQSDKLAQALEIVCPSCKAVAGVGCRFVFAPDKKLSANAVHFTRLLEWEKQSGERPL